MIMKKIRQRAIMPNENVYNAVDQVVEFGFAAIEGTKSMAVPFCLRVKKVLEPYNGISATTSYLNVPNRGYLYLVVDLCRYSIAGSDLQHQVIRLDQIDPG